MAREQRTTGGWWLRRAIGLLLAAWVLFSARPPGLAVRLPVAFVLAASLWLVADIADHRNRLHEQSWTWLTPRLASPYVVIAALIALMGAEKELSLGVALLLGLGFAAMFPGPIVAATFVRVWRDRMRSE